MTAQFARAPYRGRPGPGTPLHEPHAALLIDFDNVTMGIRSDLTKELKNLLNSDIIKGKVAVQRAYADWRRYPQYIVPLAESSVDLIFAPAYGSAKKNATDIRLAIDAVELVFTRPEIGTIILLSGDSDFSSLVLKLKEYGKYVIGVGIRESASDLLVQNCDEYYSYSALTGLTRAGDESPVVSEDPWELVEMALRQMIENNDVMRSDRLKQVLLEMDPGFDEKTLGFQKFNKFLQDAATRGIISLRKQENGQYEVGPPSAEAMEAAANDARGDVREGRSRRGRRGRGRRDESRGEPREPREDVREEPRDAAEDQPAAAEAPRDDVTDTQPVEAAAAAPIAESAAEPAAFEAEPLPAGDAQEVVEPEPAARRSRSRRKPSIDRAPVAPAGDALVPSDAGAAGPAEPAPAPSQPVPRGEAAPIAAGDGSDLAAAYELLRRATTDLVRRSGGSARDSDVKRRMLELQGGWDESALGFSKFSRFLRQAHDAEVVTLRRGDGGNYDVVAGTADLPHFDEQPDSRGGRDRSRGGRGRPPRDTQERETEDPGAAPAAAAASPPAASRPSEVVGATQASTPVPPASTPPAPVEQRTAPAAETPAAGRPVQSAVGFRRGSRGRPAASGPPPLLAGQAAPVSRMAAAQPAGQAGAQPQPAEAEAATSSAGAAPVAVQPESRTAAPAASPQADAPPAGRGKRPARKSAGGQAPAAAQKDEKPPARPAAEAKTETPKKTAGGGAKKAAKTAASPARLDTAALGLPRDAGDVATYIATTYKGIGPKSVEALIERFGASRVFDALENRPDQVRDVMGAARGDRLLAAWGKDVRARRRAAGASKPAAAPAAPAAPARAARAAGAAAEPGDEPATPGKTRTSRGRRGGRRRRGPASE
jgi:uncharacterized protein (TIGR00288 family)